MTYNSFGLLMLLSAIWGASFLFIKIGVSGMPPLSFAMLRVFIGSIVLLLIIRAKRQRLPTDPRVWAHFAVMGMLGILVPFSAISWGTQYIESGVSAILNATMPLFTFILATVWGDEQLSFERALGLLMGLGGIVVLTWPQLQGGVQAGLLQASLLGELAVVLASLSYAIAIVYARHNLAEQPPLVASLGQVSVGWLFFIPLALLEKPWTQLPSLRVIGAVLALGILGTALAYILYYRLLQSVGATATSLVTYIVPVFGIFWGWAVLNEQLSWHAFVALLMILLGLIFINGLPKRPKTGSRTVERGETIA